MKNLKTALIALSVLTCFQATAQTNFSIRTSQIDDQIIGKTDDGKFFNTTCKAHWGLKGPASYYTASMLFPNSTGDILVKVHSMIGEVELSENHKLTAKAANAICTNPNGQFNLTLVTEGQNTLVDVTSFAPLAQPERELPQIGQQFSVRTGLIQEVVAAATDKGHLYAIACSRGVIHSSADFIYPNFAGRLIYKNYNNFIFGRPGLDDLATWIPMTAKAVSMICNHPNGQYTLQVQAQGREDTPVLELIGGQTYEANNARGANGRMF